MNVFTAYRRFLKRYGRLMRSADKMMDTRLQKDVLRGAVRTAFQAGFNTPRDEPVEKVKLRKWRGRNDPQ